MGNLLRLQFHVCWLNSIPVPVALVFVMGRHPPSCAGASVWELVLWIKSGNWSKLEKSCFINCFILTPIPEGTTCQWKQAGDWEYLKPLTTFYCENKPLQRLQQNSFRFTWLQLRLKSGLDASTICFHPKKRDSVGIFVILRTGFWFHSCSYISQITWLMVLELFSCLFQCILFENLLSRKLQNERHALGQTWISVSPGLHQHNSSGVLWIHTSLVQNVAFFKQYEMHIILSQQLQRSIPHHCYLGSPN